MAVFSAIGVAIGFTAGTTAALVAGIVVSIAVVGLLVGVMMMVGGQDMPDRKDKGVRQRIATDPSNKLSLVYGNRRSSGMVTMGDITSDDATMFFIISIAEGDCESIGQVYWGDKLLYFTGSSYDEEDKQGSRDGNTGLRDIPEGQLTGVINAVGDNGVGDADDFLNGNLRMAAFPRGGACVHMQLNSSRWSSGGSSRSMPNTAYIYLELDYDREKRVTGLESKLGFYLEGKRIRTFLSDGTLDVAESYSKNPGEVLYDYLSNPIYGCGIPDSDIDLESLYRHSKFCKEEIPHTDPQGNTVFAPRYEINGTINTAGELDKNISDICTNGGGWFTYNQGKFGIVSDKSEKSVAGDVISHDNDKRGIEEGLQYIITDTGQDGTFTTFGANATPTIGEVFTATKTSEASDSAFTGEAVRVKKIFSEDNIFGGITISSGGLESLINRMTVEFPSDTEGQQEYAQVIIDTRRAPVADLPNPHYIDPDLAGSLASADEPLLEQTKKMHLTRGDVQATRIAVISVNNSRQNISVEFTTDLGSMGLKAGDIIGIRHTTPAWGYVGENMDPQNPVEAAPKLFRISVVEEETQGDNVSLLISATEYASENYIDGVIQQIDPAPNTNFSSTSRAPDIGSTTIRPKIQEYLFNSTSLDSIDVTVHSDTTVSTKELIVGRDYKITSLGDTTQSSWNLMAGTSGVTYAVDSTFNSSANVTLTFTVPAVLAGRSYTIATLGNTSQAEWNSLAGTDNANYVVGSIFNSVIDGSGSSTGTVLTDAGTGTMTEYETKTINLPGSPGSFRSALVVATAMASDLKATFDLIPDSAVEPYIYNGILVQFFDDRVGNGFISAAETTPSRTVQFYDDSSIKAVDDGVSQMVNGVPNSGLSVSFRDTDPFLDRVELRWFPSIDTNISMDPADAQYIGQELFNGVSGDKLIGNAVVTNDSPYEILGLLPETGYQIDIRALSYLGTKGDWIRIPTAVTDSLASLYVPFLTVSTVNVRAPLGDAGVFNEGGSFKVLVGNVPLETGVLYRIGTLSNVASDKVTIDSSGVYSVTELVSTDDSLGGAVELIATVIDGSTIPVTDGNSMISGKDYTITSLGTTSTANWVSAGFPAGVTPAVGISFTATGSTVGTGVVANTLAELSRDFRVGKVLDRSDELTVEIIHELETSAASGVYVVGPTYFKNNSEYVGASVTQDIGDTLASHNYKIETLGSSQADWNTLFGTSGVTYSVGDTALSAVDGTSGDGTASTTDRNYRVKAEIKKGGSIVTDLSGYTFSWFGRDSGSGTEDTLINGVLGHSVLEVNSTDIDEDSERVFRVSVSTP